MAQDSLHLSVLTRQNPLRLGMVGGGRDGFIGAVHRHGLQLDGYCSLVAGALSSDGERARASGLEIGLPEVRSYPSLDAMLVGEAALPQEQRIEAVSIVTPNHLHLPTAKAALAAGLHVVSDKPATLTLAEARELAAAIDLAGRQYALTHTYLGYPMVQEARNVVAGGTLGTIRKVYVEYTQGWMASRIEADNKQAAWRSDPARSGLSGAMADIGSHAHSLAEFVLGCPMTHVRAWLQAVVPGRDLDDDGAVFCKYEGGATGVLTASQVCAGEENLLRLRLYGERGGLDWNQEEPNTLMLKYADGRQERRRAGSNMPIGEAAHAFSRTPSGHPEGYLEAFANLYAGFALTIRARENGLRPPAPHLPSIKEALRGMAFIEAVVGSSSEGGVWKELSDG
ncbi:MAG: Gfo/Idh/MocA family oxidoreductase [Pseudomonadota bacterium]